MARAFAAASSQYLVRSTPVAAFPYTMACWFIVDDVTTDYALMDLTDSGTAFNRECIMTRGARAGDPLDLLFSQDNHAYTTNSITASIWQHAAVIASASNARRAILNGDWANSGTSTTTYNDWATIDRMDIGRLGDSTPSSYLDGRVAEAAVWAAALTQTEIEMLAKGISPLAIRPVSLAAYWPLIGKLSPEIDVVGGYDLTLGNAPTAAAHPRVLRPSQRIYGLAPYVAPVVTGRSWAVVIG